MVVTKKKFVVEKYINMQCGMVSETADRYQKLWDSTEKGVVNSVGMKESFIPSFHKHFLNTYYMLQWAQTWINTFYSKGEKKHFRWRRLYTSIDAWKIMVGLKNCRHSKLWRIKFCRREAADEAEVCNNSYYALSATLHNMHACMLSGVLLFATPWAIVHQAPLSMGFSRQDYWSRLPFPPPGNLPNPGIEPMSPHLLHCRQILYHWATRKAPIICVGCSNSYYMQ